MYKLELAVTEEIVVEATEQQSVELSLPELDLIGGGSVIGVCL